MMSYHFKFKLVIVLITILLDSCGNCDWSEEERAKFEKECPNEKAFNYLAAQFRGFDNTEFDSVIIEEYKDTNLIKLFKVKVDTSSIPWDKEHKVRSFQIEQKLNTENIYKFIVPGQIFLLHTMKMVVWQRGPFCPECTMGDYFIDSVHFEHNANPIFVKKGFKL